MSEEGSLGDLLRTLDREDAATPKLSVRGSEALTGHDLFALADSFAQRLADIETVSCLAVHCDNSLESVGAILGAMHAGTPIYLRLSRPELTSNNAASP